MADVVLDPFWLDDFYSCVIEINQIISYSHRFFASPLKRSFILTDPTFRSSLVKGLDGGVAQVDGHHYSAFYR